MVVKSSTWAQHSEDLSEVFSALCAHNLRLNSEKCVFGVKDDKFLKFMLTHSIIKANPEKCQAIIDMRSYKI